MSAVKQAVTLPRERFPDLTEEAASALARALEFDRRAGLAMRKGHTAAYQHNHEQASAAWSRYRALTK